MSFFLFLPFWNILRYIHCLSHCDAAQFTGARKPVWVYCLQVVMTSASSSLFFRNLSPGLCLTSLPPSFLVDSYLSKTCHLSPCQSFFLKSRCKLSYCSARMPYSLNFCQSFTVNLLYFGSVKVSNASMSSISGNKYGVFIFFLGYKMEASAPEGSLQSWTMFTK